MLFKVISKESIEEQSVKSHLVGFLWQVCIPLHAIQVSVKIDERFPVRAQLEDKDFLKQLQISAYQQKAPSNVRFSIMRRLQDRPIQIEPVMVRYLIHPEDFTNNARLMQFESLVTDVVDFETRQILNFAIVTQVLNECRKRQERILEIDLERRSNSSSSLIRSVHNESP